MPAEVGEIMKIVAGSIRPLGAFLYGHKIYLMFCSVKDKKENYRLAESDDGLNFNLISAEGHVIQNNLPLDLNKISDLRFSQINGDLFLIFCHQNRIQKTHLAKFASLLEWVVMPIPKGIRGTGLISHLKTNGQQFVFYGGTNDIKLAFSENLIDWKVYDNHLISPRKNNFDNGKISIQLGMSLDQNLLLIYQSWSKEISTIGAVVIDKENPNLILWRSNDWLWKTIPEWAARETSFVGALEFSGKIFSYWYVKNDGIYTVVYLHLEHALTVQSKNISLQLNKSKANPIISPKSENPWEAFTTFNPAAIYEDNKIHILYRAQGHDYSSVVGYASSDDGITISQRLNRPCYIPKEQFEATGIPSSLTSGFMSGGGYGGCEDPRITKIDDRIFMTYVAFNGNSEPRIALTSISVTDFLNHRWFWEKPVLISPPGIIDKSAVIFPEKIHEKYVILHRVFPNILMDFVDNLEFDGSTWLKGEFQIKIRKNQWDSRKIGAGAPPLKTEDGWLLIYYAVDERDSGRYKIGAMLLDIDDPRHVLHRTNNPILEPNERYENEGFKAGVAYPCGAVIIGSTLFVYYGAADTYVCVATANLEDFLAELKFANLAKLEPAYIQPVN